MISRSLYQMRSAHQATLPKLTHNASRRIFKSLEQMFE